ncbi:hypothetical protein [Candidatus Avelusimicrobium luingense]|uniref:hypothetical protein n=1 Tax=Candidatus Avelusimicrobium luingense TaxID=3416211 RepID=UPI003D0E3F01
MRLKFFILLSFLFLLGTSLPGMAQGEITVVKQAIQVPEKIGSSVEKVVNQVIAPGTQLELVFPEATSPVQLPERIIPSVSADAMPVSGQTELENRLRILEQTERFIPKYPGVFQARDLSSNAGEFTFSGTVFRDGDEVYGVIAAHTLGGLDRNPDQLGRVFIADISYKGESRSIVAEAVFISPAFDLALIKFKPKDTDLLDALELDTQLPQEGEHVSSQGFIHDRESVVLTRKVIEVSPYSFRTTMPWERDSRKGLCGSRVTKLRAQNGRAKEVIVGVHVGSSRKGDDESADIGYVAPAWQLKQMVDAYRNGEAPFAVTSDGTFLFEMQVDEYIRKIVLFDEYGQELDVLNPALGLPSQRFFRNLLQRPLLHHIEFILGRQYFADPHSSFIVNAPAVRKVSYEIPEN